MDLERLLSAFPEVAEAWKNLAASSVVKDEALAIHCACAAISKDISNQSNFEFTKTKKAITPVNIDADPCSSGI